MNPIPAVKDFWNALCKKRNPWDRISTEEINQQLFSAQATFNQWSAKVEAGSKEEIQRIKQAAGVTGPRRNLRCRQALGARRKSQVATRVAEAMLGVIETLEQMKVNREAYEDLKKAGGADLPRVVAELEAARDALGKKLIEVESIPAPAEIPDASVESSEVELSEILREVESIETMKAEGKSDSQIDAALAREPEQA